MDHFVHFMSAKEQWHLSSVLELRERKPAELASSILTLMTIYIGVKPEDFPMTKTAG